MNKIQPHIHCKKGDLNENILLPGDPARVLAITKFFDNPIKVQNNREFLSYNGKYKNIDVSAMSTGMGCPSTLIAIEELANIGVKNCIRIGTCGGLKSNQKVGDIIIPKAAIKPDGTMLGHDVSETPIQADEELTNALIQATEKLNIRYHTGINRTHDSFYETTEEFLTLKGKDLVSSEMECAAIFLGTKVKKMKGACILVVNTYEPPEEVEKNPNIVYELSDKNAVEKGIDNAIKISLEAFKILKENDNNSSN